MLAAADAVVLGLGFHRTIEHESEDRPYELPAGQDELVAQALACNPNVVAVVYGGGEFAAPWIDQVPAVLLAWYPGQCGGDVLSDLLSGKVSPSGGCDVSFTLANTGKVAASEVAQVYVAPVSPSLPRPARELKGFAKCRLEPGESRRLTVHLDPDAFAHYDMYVHDWVTDSGEYLIQVGASSREILMQAEITRH